MDDLSTKTQHKGCEDNKSPEKRGVQWFGKEVDIAEWMHDNFEKLSDEEKRKLDMEMAVECCKAMERESEIHIAWLRHLTILSSTAIVAFCSLFGTVLKETPKITFVLSLLCFLLSIGFAI